jgi:cytochrome c-type biogenesis protein CcmF
MPFEGEHLLPGKTGHFFVLVAFVASLLSTIGYALASRIKDPIPKASWLRFSRITFSTQVVSVLVVFGIIIYICSNHYFEYLYAYKHSSLELEYRYLLACVWEDQGGSFLLWSIWHCILGLILIRRSREWEAPVMTVVSLAQLFLAMMIMGIYIGGVKIGNSPFSLTRNEIAGPIFKQANYLSLIKDGVGLNVLLRNYWMVIHPPVLFWGFASTIVPFAYAYAGLQTKRYGDWIKPALPWALMSACVLGVGIMMGGKWAYESLSFGGFWAWDPVENASLVPWLILIAGIHCMIIYKATGFSLRASYLFAILTFGFILYSTFLTRTGILGDTSVHAFTEAGKAMNILILVFMLAFVLPALGLFFARWKAIPSVEREESLNSREFWMFIGALVFFLTALFIIARTSLPVYNLIFKQNIAQPEDVEFSYNKIVIFTAIITGVLTAITQFFKYKQTPRKEYLKRMLIPAAIALLLTIAMGWLYPVKYVQNPGFLGALYVAIFGSIYAVVGNAAFIWIVLKGKLKSAGGSIAHLGFALMLGGMIIAAGNKETISDNRVTGINLPMGTDPQTRKQDNPLENLTLIRQVPTRMGPYMVTYLGDSSGAEKGRKFYELLFEKKAPGSDVITESFRLYPDVYLMKDNAMSSNPDTRAYPAKDVFTYISFAQSEPEEDTAQFRITELDKGDTLFYSRGYMILEDVVSNPSVNKFRIQPPAGSNMLMAKLRIYGNDSMKNTATPAILVSPEAIEPVDDTAYAQNLYVRFAGVNEKKIKIGVKESNALIDFIALKAYVFPYINLVWIGLLLMALGFTLSVLRRINASKPVMVLTLVGVTAGLFYMFLLAN